MTTPPEAGEDRDSDAAPYLPPSLPAAPIAAVTAAAATAAAIGQPGADAPFVPMPTPVAAPPAAEPVFDAKAMVDSQKGFNAKPAYGAMPTGTEASRDAAKQLRAKGQKKRRRNQRLAWFVGVAFLGGIGAAGWFAYEEYRTDQDERAIEQAAFDDDDVDDPAALSPLGEQAEIIAGQDALNDVPQNRAGGFSDAIDDARDIAGGGAAEADAAPVAAITLADILPAAVLEIGERLPDATGRETYIVNADGFAGADPAAFGRFVRLLSTQPQMAPGAPDVEGLPAATPQQIVISVERDGDVLQRAIVVGIEVGINVDYRP